MIRDPFVLDIHEEAGVDNFRNEATAIAAQQSKGGTA